MRDNLSGQSSTRSRLNPQPALSHLRTQRAAKQTANFGSQNSNIQGEHKIFP